MLTTKKQIRKIYLQARNNLPKDYISNSTKEINKKLAETLLQHATKNSVIGLYMAIGTEINLNDTIIKLKACSVSSLPWIDYKKKMMHFKLWHYNDHLEKSNNFYCLQPKENSKTVTPSIIVIPLITCDLEGNRIGYGKGYYDKYIAQNYQTRPLIIGICYDKNIYPGNIPHEPHDCKIDIIISEKQVLQRT